MEQIGLGYMLHAVRSSCLVWSVLVLYFLSGVLLSLCFPLLFPFFWASPSLLFGTDVFRLEWRPARKIPVAVGPHHTRPCP